MGLRKRIAAGALAVATAAGAGMYATQSHDAPRPQERTFTTSVVVWNEKSFPVMSDAAYRHDFRVVLGQLPKRVVVLHQEMSAPSEVAIYRSLRDRYGLTSYGVRKNGDVAISTRGLDRAKPLREKLADKPAGPASPARFYVQLLQESPVKVAYLDIHLSNGCFAKNAHKWWYAARCQAVSDQIRHLRRDIIKPLRLEGYTLFVGGDTNRESTVYWGKHQVTGSRHGKMQIAALPAPCAAASLTNVRSLRAPLYTDHRVLVATLKIQEKSC